MKEDLVQPPGSKTIHLTDNWYGRTKCGLIINGEWFVHRQTEKGTSEGKETYRCEECLKISADRAKIKKIINRKILASKYTKYNRATHVLDNVPVEVIAGAMKEYADPWANTKEDPDEFEEMTTSTLINFLKNVEARHGEIPVSCTTMGVGMLAEEERLNLTLIEIKKTKDEGPILKIGD